ncbi:MAG TPA: GNAT family N-acetyltransferase [Firmicutes bacterium]|nr:GNAT family N-acetyltransferase [Bacillota bacterium]
MVFLKREECGRLAPLYAGVQETPVWSCLQGMMGQAAADDADAPRCAWIIVGDFCFPAGDPDAPEAAALLAALPARFLILVPPDGAWARRIEEAFPGCSRRIERYAIQKEPGMFDRARLWRLVEALPAGYRLRRIDAEWYDMLLAQEWSRSFCENFDSKEDFCRRGLGYIALYGGEPVGGASSYSVYRGGLEIEVDVQEPHRRKGIASACAARLILACLERGWYPSWDAATPVSVRLAEKLGYHLDAAYPAYEIRPDG